MVGLNRKLWDIGWILWDHRNTVLNDLEASVIMAETRNIE